MNVCFVFTLNLILTPHIFNFAFKTSSSHWNIIECCLNLDTVYKVCNKKRSNYNAVFASSTEKIIVFENLGSNPGSSARPRYRRIADNPEGPLKIS